ncbi:MAG: multicopper oxidase family protein [Vulcanimicrobiaceae bacterium]
MRRRTLLAAGSAFAATALGAIHLAPPAAAARESDFVEYLLTSLPLRFAPAPGVDVAMLGYQGRIPGPVLRVRLGQRLRVHYRNRSGSPSTIHWHGMILPNDMDGVPYLTQAPVPSGGDFVYEFAPRPAGTRWYHDHVDMNLVRGLFGMIVVEDPHDEPADAEFALVFHDVPSLTSVAAARRGTSDVPMDGPPDSLELREVQRAMRARRDGTQRMSGMSGMAIHGPSRKPAMGDEVGYPAHCINGAAYPRTTPLVVRVGDRVRLRILNANPTQTRYVRLAGHRLLVTHSDGNPLARAVEVDALRLGVAERYDAWFEVRRPGAWLLQGISAAGTAGEQAVRVCTPGMERAEPVRVAQTLAGLDVLSYAGLGGTGRAPLLGAVDVRHDYTLDGGQYGSSRWEIDHRIWPHVPRIDVRSGRRVVVHFKNTTGMDHAMHLHGHVFELIEVGGTALARPLRKDTSLVGAFGGTATWRFVADSPPGRWLLHCHNSVHMLDGMMTEVDYV